MDDAVIQPQEHSMAELPHPFGYTAGWMIGMLQLAGWGYEIGATGIANRHGQGMLNNALHNFLGTHKHCKILYSNTA